ncbi:MAG: RsmB/NOP family class I SAM-dependent RNA methyltransferase [Jatrophihabitantaceae bacterium]
MASGPPRRPSSRRPSRPRQPERPAPVDRPRLVAFQLLRAVSGEDAYANLALPALITAQQLTGRDAGLATELGYGTLRARGTLDEIVAACLDRPFAEVQAEVQDLLRLGAYQALRTRIPPHAAVATTVDLARASGNVRAAGFVNAVLRKVAESDWDSWIDRLATDDPPIRRVALRTAHPQWIAEAFRDALGGDLAETEAALAADDARPQTHLVAWPGRSDRAELVTQSGGVAGPYSPYAVRMTGGDPSALAAVHARRAGVQDEGSQLCAIALTYAPLDGRDERWLDLCAGPGGKTALLAALAAGRSATVTANELHPHRAELVHKLCAPWEVDVLVGDSRELPPVEGGYDRVLVDAPCTGLGALRRRPESRWRRQPGDVPELARLQGELLAAALRLVRPGGVVGYVTCSPHPAETLEVVAGYDLLDARAAFAGVDNIGERLTVQLWPHRHGTDAMFCALIRRSV